MKNRAVLSMIFCLLSLVAVAQSRSTMKKMFDEGRFYEAKPIFEKLLKKNPKNSEYNYWYAACCLETGDTVDVEEMLEFAVSRKIVNASRYLGDYYYGKENYPKAMEWYDDFLEKTKDDSLRVEFSRKAMSAKNLNRMVVNTEKILVVDSFVVEKDELLSVYKLSPDVGVIARSSDYFDDPMLPGYVYETEREMDIYFSGYDEFDDSKLKLYHSSKVAEEWSTPQLLMGIDTYGSDNYPFMCSDGITLYFASDGGGSIGGYDIFMTRLDTESGRFLRPDNMGMPFNSTANDYMLVVDEVANLGWFATDRNQPEGLVCVYVFVPNVVKEKYDFNALGYDGMLPFARLSSVVATQNDDEALKKARRQLAVLEFSQLESMKNNDFLFVIDDTRDYTKLSDFKSDEARKMFVEWQKCTQRLAGDVKKLEKQRDEYGSAAVGEKKRMSEEILKLEEKIEADRVAVERMEIETRRLEQEKIYK